jgi:hypothetical protein
MNPRLPDGETVWSRLGLVPHGRVWRTRMQEWPRIREEIDAGHPSPLGLVRVRSFDPFALKENHQVLAYGYEILASSLTLRLYDPNLPNRDHVTLTLSWVSPMPRPISCFPPGPAVHAFFRVRYMSSKPP